RSICLTLPFSAGVIWETDCDSMRLKKDPLQVMTGIVYESAALGRRLDKA
ncbi:4527_t:CDS:1, partial [Paraglomus occultum]